MRVMILIKATKESEAGQMPEPALLEAMGAFNQSLAEAGMLLAGEGLKPSIEGKRVIVEGAERSVVDGPFAATDELLAGFWLWRVKNMDEAVAWVKRCPAPMRGRCEIEIRPLFEAADFGDALTPDFVGQEQRLREIVGKS